MIVSQKLFVPYDVSQSRTAKERARTRLPAPTLFRGEDGTDGVPLRLAVEGKGLAESHGRLSPLWD